MDERRVNGWKNYPTWCVNLWLDNDEPTYNEKRLLIAQAIKYATDWDEDENDVVDKDVAIRALEESLKAFVNESMVPEVEGFAQDMLSYALDSVDFYELAENYVSNEVTS